MVRRYCPAIPHVVSINRSFSSAILFICRCPQQDTLKPELTSTCSHPSVASESFRMHKVECNFMWGILVPYRMPTALRWTVVCWCEVPVSTAGWGWHSKLFIVAYKTSCFAYEQSFIFQRCFVYFLQTEPNSCLCYSCNDLCAFDSFLYCVYSYSIFFPQT